MADDDRMTPRSGATPPSLNTHGAIWALDLGEGENRFSPDHLDGLDGALDRVMASDTCRALMTLGHGKFFSNGLDLAWVAANPSERSTYVERVQRLLARVLTLPVPTVAALNGHAFGAGAMLAIAHDFQVMRADCGFFCFPEVDIDLPFSRGMSQLIQAKVTARTAVEAMTTGRRYDGPAAAAAGLVDGFAQLDDLEDAAAALVQELTEKRGATLGAIKSTMFAGVVEALLEPLA